MAMTVAVSSAGVRAEQAAGHHPLGRRPHALLLHGLRAGPAGLLFCCGDALGGGGDEAVRPPAVRLGGG
jgi:hypothetical protein